MEGGLNLYTFVDNNPTYYVDYYGNFGLEASIGLWLGIGNAGVGTGAGIGVGVGAAAVAYGCTLGAGAVVAAGGVALGGYIQEDTSFGDWLVDQLIPIYLAQEGASNTKPKKGSRKRARVNKSNKSDPHGDKQALEKVKNQIDKLKEKLKCATGREKKAINQKIQNIIRAAQKKYKGETHWFR